MAFDNIEEAITMKPNTIAILLMVLFHRMEKTIQDLEPPQLISL